MASFLSSRACAIRYLAEQIVGRERRKRAGALRVVTFCELPEGFNKAAPVERWDDIPPVSEDYGKSRDAMVERIRRLMDDLKPAKKQ